MEWHQALPVDSSFSLRRENDSSYFAVRLICLGSFKFFFSFNLKYITNIWSVSSITYWSIHCQFLNSREMLCLSWVSVLHSKKRRTYRQASGVTAVPGNNWLIKCQKLCGVLGKKVTAWGWEPAPPEGTKLPRKGREKHWLYNTDLSCN